MKQNHKRRAIELSKDVLILLLTCSALWLAARTQLLAPLDNLLGEERPQMVAGQEQTGTQTGSALPMAMVVNVPEGKMLTEETGLPGEGEGIRSGIVHDQEACQELFQQVAGVLVEAMSGTAMPEPIDREQWEAALTQQLGVYMDFQGELPMPVLAAWLSGGSTQLQGSVRRLILAGEEDGVVLYYRNEEDGNYYRCACEMGDGKALEQALASFTDNGVFYAFESEEYQILAPDTLLFPNTPNLEVYSVSNPVNGGEASLQELVRDLGFSLNSTNFYSTDEWVARSGDDSVRLSERGTVEYTAGDDNGVLPVIQGDGSSLYQSVETCRKVAAILMNGRCGDARLYLSAVRETQDGWEIEFDYSLNGIPVCMDQGSAAHFVVSDGKIAQFTMRLRSYAASGTTSAVMPPKQALAAFSALDLEGQELMLTYTDSGGDTVSAGWAARQESGKEE